MSVRLGELVKVTGKKFLKQLLVAVKMSSLVFHDRCNMCP